MLFPACYNENISPKVMPSKKFKIYIFLGIAVIFAFFVLFQKNNASKQTTSSQPTETISKNTQSQTENQPTQKNCPSGFILVPGDPLYHTDDFCVMKYDAKCALSSDITQGIQPDNGSACAGEKGGRFEGTYKNNGPGCACRGNKQIVSAASGFPVTFLPLASNDQDNAKAYCQARRWHVMTNSEWMTIARNAEQVPENWCDQNGSHCGFAPGTSGKILANGHNDSNNEMNAGASSDGALAAGADSQPCFGTTTDGSNACGSNGSQKRTLQLSNGGILWDFAGNVWSWVDATIARKDQPQSQTNGVLDRGFIWSDFTPGSLSSVITDNGQPPSLGYDAFRPSNPVWNATNGVGRIYHFSGAADNSTVQYGLIRGGNWRHGYDSGAFCVHLSPPPSTANIDDVGFRCAASLQ